MKNRKVTITNGVVSGEIFDEPTVKIDPSTDIKLPSRSVLTEGDVDRIATRVLNMLAQRLSPTLEENTRASALAMLHRAYK